MASAAVLCRYRGTAPVRYWKPVQTGIEEDDDTAEVRRLAGCAHREVFERGVRLPRPLSPHLAARLSGQPIEVARLIDEVACEPPSDRWVVEGAGGVLVPLNESELMADLLRVLQLPVLIVARTTLGTINHTLLTIEALRARSATVAGVLLVGHPSRDNREAIEQFGRVAIVGELPLLEPLHPRALQEWAVTELDRAAHLERWFQ